MSHYDKLVELIGRIERTKAKLEDKSGKEWRYSAEVDGKRQKYILRNIKNPEDYTDEVSGLLVWIWGYYDHAKKYLIEKGCSLATADQDVQRFIRTEKSIMICMDTANHIKHSGLRSGGLTGLEPQLKEVGFSVPFTEGSSIEEMGCSL